MMNGVNVEATVEMARHGGVPVIASGGVTDLEDVQKLADVSAAGIVGAITGRAIYEGKLDLAEAQTLCDTIEAQQG